MRERSISFLILYLHCCNSGFAFHSLKKTVNILVFTLCILSVDCGLCIVKNKVFVSTKNSSTHNT